MNTTAAKFDRIEALAIAAGWINQAGHEARLAEANRMWNRGAITDALQAYVDENRAGKGLAPIAECTRRISYRDPQYERITVHVELRDGKIHSAALDYFDKTTRFLTGIIRYLGREVEMNEIRAKAEAAR